MTRGQLDVDSLHYYEPELDHRDGVTLCKACATCLLGMDVEFHGLRPGESCASCDEVQGEEPSHSLLKATEAVSIAVAACATEEELHRVASTLTTRLAQALENWWTT